MVTTIRTASSSVPPGGPAPSFTIRTDRAFAWLEVASDPILFNGANAARRRAENFFTTRDGPPARVRGGRVVLGITPGAWRELARFAFLSYRAVAFEGTLAAPARQEATTPNADYQRAPAIRLLPPRTRLPPRPRYLSAALPWLRVEGNRLVDPAGDVVVLRGVNRSGMESTDRGGRDPSGRPRPTSREAAGITRAEIREIVREWRANVIRLPINQEWALTRPDYLLNIDRIVEWAAAEGAHTILALAWLDARREFGQIAGQPNRTPPMPEENSVRMWAMLASRYRHEPAVLYDILDEPHAPLPDDTSFTFREPTTAAGWRDMWHDWLRRIEAAIHRESPRAVLLASGWDWALSLRDMPVRRGANPLPNIVYSSHLAFSNTAGRSTATPADLDAWFDGARLRSKHPVFVGRWAGRTADLAWGSMVESYLRARHRFTSGIWQGIAGWTASSWADKPLLVERGTATRTVRGRQVTWRTFVMAGGHRQPTEFGELVRGALHAMPFAPTLDFSASLPRGSRTRYLISPGTPRQSDFFTIAGHDFDAGTRIAIEQGGADVWIRPDLVLPQLLVVARLPAAVATGASTVRVERSDGVVSERVAVTVLAAPVVQTVLQAGAAKASPFTILFLANPAIETTTGAFLADPIQARRADFHRAVIGALRALFARHERVLHAYARDIRIVARFAPDAVVAANALCRRRPGATTSPRRSRTAAYLTANGLSADLVFVVFRAPAFGRNSALMTLDDTASAGSAFTYDGAAHQHRRAADEPGVVALSAPLAHPMTPLHEFFHAFAGEVNGDIDDLYVDTPLLPTLIVNRKRRPVAGGPIPAVFARYGAVDVPSDRRRDGLRYPRSWRSFHPQLVSASRPNVMDNYKLVRAWHLCRLDRLTLRFVRERLEWKLGR